jgi:hypothetical protein
MSDNCGAARPHSKKNFKGNHLKFLSIRGAFQEGDNCGSGELTIKHSPTDQEDKNLSQMEAEIAFKEKAFACIGDGI